MNICYTKREKINVMIVKMWYGNVPTTSSITISIGIVVLMANFLLVPFLFYEIKTIWEDFDEGITEVQELRLRVLDELMKITNTSDTYLRTRRSSAYKVLVDRNSRNASVKHRRHRKRRYEIPNVEYYSSRPRRYELNYPYVFRLRRTKEPSCMCILHNTCPPGPPGEKGSDGVPGEHGLDGPDGKQGATEFSWGTDSGLDLHSELCLSCPPGPPGELGPMGPRGRRGTVGASGEPGIPGSPGRPGLSGLQGHIGEEGDDGNMGDFGTPGLDAEQVVFLPGPKGEAGFAGKSGSRGDPGKPNKESGIPGTPGPDGRRGKRGKQGLRGRIGYQGAAGHKRCPCPDKTIDIKDVTYYADPKFQVFPSIIFKEEPMDMSMVPEQTQSEGGEFEGTLESMSSDASPETLSPEFVNNLLGLKNRLIEIRRSPQKDEKRFKRDKENDPLVLVVGNGVLTVQQTPKLPYKQSGLVDLKSFERKGKAAVVERDKANKKGISEKGNWMKWKRRNEYLKKVGAIGEEDSLLAIHRKPHVHPHNRAHGVKHRKPKSLVVGKKQVLSYSKLLKKKADRAIKNKSKTSKKLKTSLQNLNSTATKAPTKLNRKEISLKKNRHSTWVERRGVLANLTNPPSEYAQNLKSIHDMLKEHLHPDPLYKIENEIQANKEEVTGPDGKSVLLQEIANEVLKRLEKEETNDLPKPMVSSKKTDKSVGGGVIPMNNQLSLSTGKRVDVGENKVNH